MIKLPASLLILSAVAFGCSSTRGTAARLPFHVAIVPIEVHSVETSAASGVPYCLDAAELSAEVSRSLGETCFTRTTILRPPDGVSLQDFRASSRIEQDAHWLAASRDVRADLLLEGVASYVPIADGSRNERFWLNLPLFLLGGPAGWFIADRKYEGDVTLQCTVRDVNAAIAGTVELGSAAARLASVASSLDRVDLNLLSRAGNGVHHYLLSMLVPPGLLAQSGASVQRQLELRIPRALAADLATAVTRTSSRIRQAPDHYEFYLASLAVDSNGPQRRLVGEVVLREEGVRALAGYMVHVDGVLTERGTLVDGRLDSRLSGGRHRYRGFSLSSILPSQGTLVRLTLVGSGRAARRRTYTAVLADLPSWPSRSNESRVPPPPLDLDSLSSRDPLPSVGMTRETYAGWNADHELEAPDSYDVAVGNGLGVSRGHAVHGRPIAAVVDQDGPCLGARDRRVGPRDQRARQVHTGFRATTESRFPEGQDHLVEMAPVAPYLEEQAGPGQGSRRSPDS